MDNKKESILKELGLEAMQDGLTAYSEWKVGIKPNDTIVNLLYFKAKTINRNRPLPFSEDTFRKYLVTLFKFRVDQVVGVFVPQYVRRLLIPGDIAYTLSQIGIAKDPDYRKVLVPQLSPEINEEDLLNESSMVEVSYQLLALQDNGFFMVNGLPEKIEGNLFLMALTFQGNVLMSYAKQDPAFAMFAFVTDICNLSVQLKEDHVVRYGFKETWERSARSFIL